MKAVSVVVGGALAGVGGGVASARNEESRRRQGISLHPMRRGWSKRFPSRLSPPITIRRQDAGVVVFIDRQLVGPYARYQRVYRDGLRALQETCGRQFGEPFEAIPWDDQTKVLAVLEAGRAPQELWKSPTCTEFFNLVLEHTKQGFYGSPQDGGNRNYVSFKMLGLDRSNWPRQNRDPGGKP